MATEDGKKPLGKSGLENNNYDISNIEYNQAVVKEIDCFGRTIEAQEYLSIIAKAYGFPTDPNDDMNLAFARFIKDEGLSISSAELAACGFVFDRIETGCSFEEFAARRRAAKAAPPLPQLPLVIGRCGLLKDFCENGGKDANYSQWRGTLSLIKFCAPFEAGNAIEILCGSHGDYDYNECLRKMTDISAPFRCETMSGDACNSCKYQGHINSPISLGWQYEPSQAKKKKVAA